MRRKDAKKRHRKAVAEVAAELDRKLVAMTSDPELREKINATMDARGRTKRRPKAEETY